MIVESGILEKNSLQYLGIDEFRHQNGYKHIANDPRWPLFVQSIYGHKAYYIGVKSDEKFVAYAVGNLCRISTSGKNKLVLGAFLDYGVTMYTKDSSAQEIALVEEGMLLSMKPNGVVTKEINPLHELSTHSHAILDLTGHTTGSFQKQINSSRLRDYIRQFELHPSPVATGDKYLPEFYDLYLKRMKDFGTPAHPMRYFLELLRTFNAHILVWFDESGYPTSGSVSVYENGLWIHMYAVGDRRRRKGNPGDRVLWEEIKISIEKQAESFWLGRSIRNSDIEKYKQKWNPILYSTCESIGSRRSPNMGFQEINNEGVKNYFAKTWTKLPTIFTTMSNSTIRKWIP